MLFSLKNVVKQRQREQGYRLLIRNLQIPAGARVAITGPSGCGKSTTLDILGLSLRPDAGDGFSFAPKNRPPVNVLEIWESGKQDVLAGLRLHNMGYVLQSGELVPFLNVMDNMTLTARLAGLNSSEAEKAARAFGEELGIERLYSAMPSTLSVGERQRVAIARALTPDPEVILADEPTAALDPLHAEKVMEAFLNAVGKTGSTLILVTHNLEWALAGGLEEIPFDLRESEDGVTAILDYSPAGARA